MLQHGKKIGWRTGKNKNKLCGDSEDLHKLFGLFWVTAKTLCSDCNHPQQPGYWAYIGNTGPLPGGNPPPGPINCLRGPNIQNDFFSILYYALVPLACGQGDTDARRAKTFAVGASLIDQYDSGATCTNPHWNQNPVSQEQGCDLDEGLDGLQRATHTTVIKYLRGGNDAFTYGMEKNYPPGGGDPNSDAVCGDNHNDRPHRPSPAPVPISSGQNATIVTNHAFSNVGELGYGIDTSNLPTGGPSTCAPNPVPGAGALPTLDFSSPSFTDAPILDFFSYNPISSAYPRAGIVNLYTRNAPVLAAMLAGTLRIDAAGANPNPTPVVSQAQATNAASAIVTETKNVLAGSPGYGPVTQTDLTRAIAARLVAAGASASGWTGFTTEQKESIARALAEMGQTRTWNLLIDVIAQTGHYGPNAQGLTDFIPEGEKRYWLHIALGRDLVHADGTPCGDGVGCQVDVLGTQLEEVTE